jgi:energy-coupling factor transporter transmembrane protein EcfT
LPEALERRALTVALAVPETLRTLYDLKNEFQRIHPQVLGALCNAVAETLKGLHSTPVPKLTRLADATMLALAAAPSLRLQHQHILEAIAERSRNGPTQVAL